MSMRIRYIPPVCLMLSLLRLLTGKLAYSNKFVGAVVKTGEGEEFEIFRHVRSKTNSEDPAPAVLLVRFKFSTLSHSTNKFISQFPMLLITGYPGFRTKMYGVNRDNGYWTGFYEWESREALEKYKKSFVLKMMNKRAIPGSVSYRELENESLDDVLQKML